MTPADFPQANRTLTKPEGMTDSECGPLPTYTDGATCISCWRLTWRERLAALFSGRVWLGVLSGQTQPPVWLVTQEPFAQRRKGIWQRFPFSTAALVLVLTLVLAFLLSGATFAEDDGPRVAVTAGGLVTMSGEGTAVTPTVFVDVESPLAIGSKAPLRFYGRIGISSAPGESVDVADPQTFKSAEAGFGIGYKVGEHESGVYTMLVAEAGFSTRLPGDPEPLNRVLHHWLAGLRLGDKAGNQITFGLGRDQVADASPADPLPDGTIPTAGGLQAIIYGQLAIPATSGVVLLVGDATVNVVVPSDVGARKRDVVRLGIATDLARAASLLAGKDKTTARPAEVARPPASPDASVGPPAPRGRWS